MKTNPLAGVNFVPIFLMIGGLAFAVLVGSLIGSGDWSTLYVPALAIIGTVSVLALGSRYWLLIPFSLSFTAPVIPLGSRAVELPELTIVVCTIIFLARIALTNQRVHLLRKDHLPFLLYAGWAALIYFHHPIGLSVFGSSSGGGRFYMKIFLALAAFLIVVNQKITNRDCKWILIGIVVGTALDFVKLLLFYYLFGGSSFFVDPLENYSWQQEISSVPLILVLIVFSRYSSQEIFSLSKIWRPLLLLASIPIILVSGKRSASACLLLYPIIAAFCRKEFRYVALWIVCALVAAIVLVGGQGTLFHLPLNAQRALSWLPGKWDSRMAYVEGGKDVFRAKLRKYAEEKIRKDPWIGTGYDVHAQASQRLTLTMANKFDASILQMALGSQWHNRWLGYAADFGIPASILVAIIFLFVIVRAWQTFPRLPPDSLLQTMVMYVLIITVTDVAFSHVSGHSANDTFTRWWMYGLLISIAVSLRKERSSIQVDSPRFQPAILGSGPEPVRLRG